MKQFEKPAHGGGAMCHFPIHGLRIYKGEKVLYEGTFCWMCSNFSIQYPRGTAWLDTSADLKKLFTKLMPIPQTEMDRFYKKYPGAKPKKVKPASE